jgi:hypothetical protein
MNTIEQKNFHHSRSRKQKAAMFLAPVVAGASIFGVAKWAENVTKPPKKATAAEIRAVNPAYAIPKPKEGKIYLINDNLEDAEEIVAVAYPDVELYSSQFEKLKRMVNLQLPETGPYAIIENDQALDPDRFGSQGQAVRLTRKAQVPIENTPNGFKVQTNDPSAR